MRIGTLLGVGLLLLCLAVPATAAGPEVYLLGGLSIANLGGDADQVGEVFAAGLEGESGVPWSASKKSRTGFDLGVGVSFPFTDAIGGAVEVRYAMRGAKWDLTDLSDTYPNVTATMKLNYIEFPVLLQITPPASGAVQPVLLVGPVLGFKATADFEAEVLGQSSSESMDGMKSVYFGGLIGAGIRVRATPKSSFLLQARYQQGFTNLVDDSTFSMTSSAFSFMAGWSFGL